MIQIEEDNSYTPGSAGNKNSYDLIHTNNEDHLTHKIAVKKMDAAGNIVKSALLCYFGFSGAGANTYILDENRIYILAGKYLVCLAENDLALLWKREVDPSSCFGLKKIKERLIVHGEQVVSCFALSGDKLWEFYGRDIFVSITGKNCCEIENNLIHLTDFNEHEYFLDIDGKLAR